MILLLGLLLFAPHSLAWDYNLELAKERLKQMDRVTTTHEMVDSVVDDLCETFLELCLDSEEEMRILKRELIEHAMSKDRSLRADVLAGFPTKYKYIPIVLRKAKALGKKILPKLIESEINKYKDVDDFIFKQMLYYPMREHANMKQRQYEYLGLTEAQIKEHLLATQMRLINLLYKDDHGNDLDEDAKDAIRKKYVKFEL